MMFYAAIYSGVINTGLKNQRGGIGYHDSTRSISRVVGCLFVFGVFVHLNCFDVDQRVWRLV